MKIRELLEATSGTGTNAIAASPVAVGPVVSRNMYNKDGTMKNGVDMDNLLGTKKKAKKRKKA